MFEFKIQSEQGGGRPDSTKARRNAQSSGRDRATAGGNSTLTGRFPARERSALNAYIFFFF